MDARIDTILSLINPHAYIVLLIFGVYFFFIMINPTDTLKALRKMIHNTSRTYVYAKIYQVARNVRLAIVYPFQWRLINYNNTIAFALPPNTAGHRCPLGSTPAAIYNDYSQSSLLIECVGVSVQAMDTVIESMPFERLNINASTKNETYNDVTAIQIINILLKKGIFTLEKMK